VTGCGIPHTCIAAVIVLVLRRGMVVWSMQKAS